MSLSSILRSWPRPPAQQRLLEQSCRLWAICIQRGRHHHGETINAYQYAVDAFINNLVVALGLDRADLVQELAAGLRRQANHAEALNGRLLDPKERRPRRRLCKSGSG